LAAAILLFGLTANGSVANADSWRDGTAAFARKEYAAAMKLFRPLAEKGNALAQYKVAMMHKLGLGVPKSQKEARKWSKLAAKQGNADAQQLLGSLYYKESGEESPDTLRAYVWYEMSAAQGNTEAQKDLVSLAKEMTPQQVAEAREKAQKCKSPVTNNASDRTRIASFRRTTARPSFCRGREPDISAVFGDPIPVR
jgi:TPR repeat protein